MRINCYSLLVGVCIKANSAGFKENSVASVNSFVIAQPRANRR